MAELKLRIDDMTKAGIHQLARQQGMSLNKYVEMILCDHLVSPEQRSLEDKYENTVREVAAAYHSLVLEQGEVMATCIRSMKNCSDRSSGSWR